MGPICSRAADAGPFLPGWCFQVYFGHYQQGSRIVPSILADLRCQAAHFRLSGPDLSVRIARSVLARMRRYGPAGPGIHVTLPGGVAVQLRTS